MQQLHFRGFEPYLKPRKPSTAKRIRNFFRRNTTLLFAGIIAVSGIALIYESYQLKRQADQFINLITEAKEQKKKAEIALIKLEEYEKQRPDLIAAIRELKELKMEVKDSVALSKELSYKINGMRELGEEDIEEIKEVIGQIFNMPIEEISSSYDTYSVLFTLFDWIRDNIEYLPGSSDDRLPLTPSELIYYKIGDCDEQAALLAGMIKIALSGSTRIVSTIPDNDGIGHAYSQFYLGTIGQLGDVTVFIEAIENALQSHYQISIEGVKLFLRSNIDSDGTGNLWLTLDTTYNHPWRSCARSRDCKPESILYQW